MQLHPRRHHHTWSQQKCIFLIHPDCKPLRPVDQATPSAPLSMLTLIYPCPLIVSSYLPQHGDMASTNNSVRRMRGSLLRSSSVLFRVNAACTNIMNAPPKMKV
eukprot:scaffold77952_cov48-Cyclotella_meneghiniana.AAC.3